MQFRPITFVVGPLGQQANDDHSARPIDSDHKIDGIRPTLSRADADPNDLTKIILTFSEAIGTVDNTKITVKKGGTDQTIDRRRDRLDGRDEGRGDVGYGAPDYRHRT